MKKIWLIILVLISGLLSLNAFARTLIPIQKKETKFVLYKFCMDAKCLRDNYGWPYRISLDGAYVDVDLTNEAGEIITTHRQLHTKQSFVMQLYNMGTYSIEVDEKNKSKAYRLSREMSASWESNCDEKKQECKGKGFYWIRLLGNNTNFEGEPYAMLINGKLYQGNIDKEGYIFISFDDPEETAMSAKLAMCNDISFDLSISRENLGSRTSQTKTTSKIAELACQNSQLKNYAVKNSYINKGLPILLSAWQKGEIPSEKIKREKQEAVDAENQKLEAYEKAARDNNDNLSWLGPMPAIWSEDENQKKFAQMMVALQKDIEDFDQKDLFKFQCLSPAQVGPVPKLEAVNAYLNEFPDSIYNAKLMEGLFEAAKEGNWLARAQIYVLYTQLALNDLVLKTRLVQLSEWMQKNKIGAFYAMFSDGLKASGYYSDMPNIRLTNVDVYAALHNAYAAQNEVGKVLIESDDPALKQVGEKMLACASNSLPAYKRLFNGDVQKDLETKKAQNKYDAYPALHKAVINGNVAEVKRILQTDPTAVNQKSRDKLTPIALALLNEKQNLEIIQLLISAGADVKNQGSIAHPSDISIKESLLSWAVKNPQANLEIIKILVNSGAEIFNPYDESGWLGNTPFSRALFDKDGVKNVEIVEYFLNTKQLNPKSEIAIEYLTRSISYPKAYARLIQYGISPNDAPELLSELISRSQNESQARDALLMQSIINDYPAQKKRIVSQEAYKDLSQAVYNCKFTLANVLIDAGTPIKNADKDDWQGSLAAIMNNRCSDQYVRDDNGEIKKKIIPDRKEFLIKLKQLGFDFNALEKEKCPAWMSRSSFCEVPKDVDLTNEYLSLGASLYLGFPDHYERVPAISGISNLIDSYCTSHEEKPEQEVEAFILSLMQRSSPLKNKMGLESGLRAIANCKPYRFINVAKKLRELGAVDQKGR